MILTTVRWWSLFVAFLAVSFLTKASVGPVHGSEARKQQHIIRGPLFIAVVYPVVELRRERLEMIGPIRDAYSLWGRTILSVGPEKAYFPAPLSYPYQYTRQGLSALQQELKKNVDVEPNSVHARTFPNMLKAHQEAYEPSELNQIVINEPYVTFRLKRWSDIEFMSFPTFVVLAFDYTKGQIKANRDYQEIKKQFIPRINEFQKMVELQTSLGISRQRQKWAAVPILTFTAIDSYELEVMKQIYFSGPIAEAEARRLFLQHVSLRDFSKDLDASDPVVTQCHGIGHEMSMISQWRFYYAYLPLFFDRPFGHVWDGFPMVGAWGKQSRILRVALFINVTLPSLLKWSDDLAADLISISAKIQDTRVRLLNEFTQKIDDLSVPIREAIAVLQTRIDPARARLQEVELGYEELAQQIQFAFIPPRRLRRTKIVEAKEEDICLRLFYFTERGLIVSDREKAESHIREIRRNIAAIQSNKERLSNDVAGALSFLEERRSLIWSREDTNLSIKTSEENTKRAIEASEKNTREAINQAEWHMQLSILASVVVAIIILLINKFYDVSFLERHRRKKATKKLLASNRKISDEL
jgi:hypothetical protein